jgi:hypothetical protein
MIGVTTNAVSAWEVGRVRLVDQVIIRCAIILEVSADELLGLTSLSIEEPATLKIMRRVQKIARLSPAKQKLILQNLDMAIQGVVSQSQSRYKPQSDDSPIMEAAEPTPSGQ